MSYQVESCSKISSRAKVATNRNVALANDSSFKIPRGSCCHDDDDVHDVDDVDDDDDT